MKHGSTSMTLEVKTVIGLEFSRREKSNQSETSEKRMKTMIATFFARWGHVITIKLIERKTVNSEWYSEVCVPKIAQEWHFKFKKRVRKQILWHHDNASAHTTVRTMDTLVEYDIQLHTHPP